jgi:hypothetical protein
MLQYALHKQQGMIFLRNYVSCEKHISGIASFPHSKMETVVDTKNGVYIIKHQHLTEMSVRNLPGGKGRSAGV